MKSQDSVISVRFKGVLGSFELDVAFEAPMPGITALLGPSASGKTTILRCIAGLSRLPGCLVVGGDVWQDETGAFRPAHARPIGYVFQEPSLFPHLSVKRNLLYGYGRSLKTGAPEGVRFEEVVELLGIAPLLERATAALSGGERQRVALGRALLSQPRLLLMDEPLAALDRETKEEILPYFETLHETLAIPVVYVSHDISEVERLADHLVLLDQGIALASGPLAEVLSDARLPVARGPHAASVLEAEVRGFDPKYCLTEMDVSGAILMIPGHAGDRGRRRVRIAAADVSLSPDRPTRTSILNVFPVRVVEIIPLDESQVTVVLTIGHRDAGAKMLARISRRALETLGFAPGQGIYAQVKAVSLIASGPPSASVKRGPPLPSGIEL